MAINARDLTRQINKPWAVFLNTVGLSQPAEQSFYTMPGINFSFNSEWVKSKAYGRCGVLFTVNKGLQSFELMVSYQVNQLDLVSFNTSVPGELDSTGAYFEFDGTEPSQYAYWFESCYTKSGLIARLYIPKGQAGEPVELATGEGYVTVPTTVEAIYDPADTATFPTLYIELPA